LSLNWTINGEGELVITYASGMVQTVTTLERQGVLNGFVYDFVAADSTRFATYNFGVKQDPGFILSESYMINTPGQFWFAGVNSWSPGNYDSDGNVTNYWGWEVGSAGFMLNRDFFSFPGGLWSREMTWQITPDNTFRFDGPWWRHCYFDVVPSVDCVYREWTPLAKVANGGPDGNVSLFYALEEATAGGNFWILDPATDVTYFPARINVYMDTVKPAIPVLETLLRQ